MSNTLGEIVEVLEGILCDENGDVNLTRGTDTAALQICLASLKVRSVVNDTRLEEIFEQHRDKVFELLRFDDTDDPGFRNKWIVKCNGTQGIVSHTLPFAVVSAVAAYEAGKKKPGTAR